MRLANRRSTLAAGLLVALALMPAAVQAWDAIEPMCNVGSPASPAWVACSGAWSGNASESPADRLAMLQLIQDPASWMLPSGADINTSTLPGWSVIQTWTTASYVGKTDEGVSGGPFQDIPSGMTSGMLNFVNPYTGTFVIILKGATKFSLYLFNSDDPVYGIAFTMAGVTGDNALSHAELWGGSEVSVPEPSSLLLLGSGLLGLGFVGYRRRRK